MGEAARALEVDRVYPGAWMKAVRAARLSRGALRTARVLVNLPSFPDAFPSLRRLGQLIDADKPVSRDQVRAYFRELERPGLLERKERFDSKEHGGDGSQLANYYEATLPEVVPLATFPMGGMGSSHALGRESDGRGFSQAPPPVLRKLPEQSRAAERVCVPARDAAAIPPPRAVATAAAPSEPAAEPERPSGFAADLHDALASFSATAATAAPSTSPPQATQRAETPAARPQKLGIGSRVHGEVVEGLKRLPGGDDAVHALARHALSEAEQRRVLERALTYHRTHGIRHAGKLMHGLVRDVLSERDRKAESAAAEEHDYVPDGGPVPEALRVPPGYLAAPPVRRAPPPRDPLRDRLAGELARLAIAPKGWSGRAALVARIDDLKAQLARQAERGGLRLVPS